jgi:UDP-N-acetylglucosamine 2-epimerase (non-hydrolysing)
MKEVLDFHSSDIDSSKILTKLELSANNYFLISSHREENVDSPKKLKLLMNVLECLIKEYNLPIIFSTHPRTKKRLEDLKITFNPMIKFLKPFGFFDYVKLQINARCVLSDSGTITEESSILNFPALNLRETHERPEGFEEGSVMMVGLDADLISQSLLHLNGQPRGEERVLNLVQDYSSNNVSEKVLRIIYSYTNFIDKKVWNKQ